MARFALSLILFLSACGNAVVTTPQAPGDVNPNALLPGAEAGDAGSEESLDSGSPAPFDAGPPTSFLSGQVMLPNQQGANGATVTLTPANLSTTVQDADYLFDAVPLGPFTLTVTLAGYQSATVTGNLTAQGLSENEITLEASWPLFAPDGGFSPTWMAFAPDGGPLYAADIGSLWNIALDGGAATPLTTGAPTVKPLGFATDGTPVYFTGYEASADGGSGSGFLDLGGGVGLTLTFLAPGPYLIGDSVFFAPPSGSAPPYQAWSAVSAKSPAPAVALAQAFASPAPQPTRLGLCGYSPMSVWGDSCAQAFMATGSRTPALLSPICAPAWSLPTAIGVSPDGTLVALEYSDSTNYGVNNSDSWQVEVISASSVSFLSPHGSAAQLSALTAIVPLSTSSAAELYEQGSMMLDYSGSASNLQGTQVAALSDGSAMYLDGSSLHHGTQTLPFGGAWSQPVVSPDGAHVVFPGVPMVVDVAAWTSMALAETPQTAEFSTDGAELLVVGTNASLHVVTFPNAGVSDAQLEGTANLALLTSNGKAVVYAGSDPHGSTGIFEQPAMPGDGGTP